MLRCLALDFLPMVKKEMAEGPVPARTAPFCVGNDKSFGRWRGKSATGAKPRARFEILLAPTRVWSVQPDCDRPG